MSVRLFLMIYCWMLSMFIVTLLCFSLDVQSCWICSKVSFSREMICSKEMARPGNLRM